MFFKIDAGLISRFEAYLRIFSSSLVFSRFLFFFKPALSSSSSLSSPSINLPRGQTLHVSPYLEQSPVLSLPDKLVMD